MDAGSPITTVHYSVLNGAGETVAPTKTVSANDPQAIEDLETPHERGSYTLRLWLDDAEGNVGAPIKAPLTYDCVKSEVGGGLTLTAGLGKHDDGELAVGQKEGSTLSGKLEGLGGQLANAPLCVFSRVVTDQSPTSWGSP